MSAEPISLVIITKNEERNISRCILSVSFADEIIVVDSGSTDKTLALAESLGARCLQHEWQGYYKQKSWATEQAKNRWVLSLDADEALSPELAMEIQRVLQKPVCNGYLLPRMSYHMHRWIRHGGWYPDRQLRLFNKKLCQWTEGEVHERVVGTNIGKLKYPILHWVFKDLKHQVHTNNEYSSLGAKELYKKGKRFNILLLIFKPLSKFIETYLWKRGFLDGLPGFIIAVGAAYSVFLKFSKLYEYSLNRDSNN